MTGQYPSQRWINAAQRATDAAGGWTGPATWRAMLPRAEWCYRVGMTAQQAGVVLAREYRLHSSRNDWRELALQRHQVWRDERSAGVGC